MTISANVEAASLPWRPLGELFVDRGLITEAELETALAEQAANYFRLVALLIGGLGMLYIVSGRLNAEGFVFASLLDRPLVPLVMAVLWYLEIIPGPLALLFAIQDFGSFLWTLTAWRAEHRTRA